MQKRPGPASTLGEVRDQLIEAGLHLLGDRGVDIGLDAVSLSDAIAAAGVARSTAYRSLADDELNPQAVLHEEIQRALLTRHHGPATVETITTAVLDELAAHGSLDDGDVASRTRAMRGVIRAGANASYQGVADSTERAVLTSLYGALQSASKTRDWRRSAIEDGERELTSGLTQMYTRLLSLFDYKLKEPYKIEHFTVAAAALVEGLAMRHEMNEFAASVDRPTGPDGALQPWSLFAVGFEQLLVGMMEPANPADPYADLARY